MVDNNKQSKEKILNLYTDIDEYLLGTIKSIISYSNIPQITQNIISLTTFLYLQENIGLIRAKGSAIIIEKNPTISEIIQYASIQKIISEYEKTFLSLSNPNITKYYNQLKHSNSYKQYLIYNNAILSKQLQDLTPIVWFDTITNVIKDFIQVDYNDYAEGQAMSEQPSVPKSISLRLIDLNVSGKDTHFEKVQRMHHSWDNQQRILAFIETTICNSSSDFVH
jgi:hypothetical protein